eukprot:4419724-Pyramimonas_sp.AAC.1
MHAGIVVGAVLHTAYVVYASAVVCTRAVLPPCTLAQTDAVLHAAAVVYIGGVVYTCAVVHAGTV